MCNQHQSQAMCHFVPRKVLQHIADNEDAPNEARKAAIATLTADQDFRQRRVEALAALASGQASTAHDDSDVPAAQGPIAEALVLKRAIYDAKNLPTLPGTLVRRESDPRTRDRQVNYVFDGVGITVQFFHAVYRRNAIDGYGRTPIVTVHVDRDARPRYNNAFFDGSQVAFGDGDGIIFDYFGDSLDVVAHELTYAVTHYTAGIAYEMQAGGLNELISDVFAALNLFTLTTKGPALRNIAHPGTAYNDPLLSRDTQIAHFSQYNNVLDVHDASGIPNRAFYLIAIGFGGFAWLKAGKILYETLIDPRVKVPGGAITFKQWADVTVDKAQTLFDVAASIIVRNAWVSVGVLV